MRDIKFRAWDTKYKKFDDNPLISGGISAYIDSFENFGFYPEGRMILQQYTGLKDNNGKEIYEGDVVHSKTLVNGFESIGQVIFRDAHFLFQAINSQFGSSGWVSDLGIVLKEYEVIGNIYENPDLLKEGKANG